MWRLLGYTYPDTDANLGKCFEKDNLNFFLLFIGLPSDWSKWLIVLKYLSQISTFLIQMNIFLILFHKSLK